MKAYVATTGAIFALLTLAHVLRMIGEDAGLATDPVFLAVTAASAGLYGGSGYVLRRAGARPGDIDPAELDRTPT